MVFNVVVFVVVAVFVVVIDDVVVKIYLFKERSVVRLAHKD